MRCAATTMLLVMGSLSAAVAPGTPATTPVAGRVICRVVGRDDCIIVRAGAAGPTYAVETNTGETVVEGAGLNKLAVSHPQLFHSIKSMSASAKGPTANDLAAISNLD